MENSRLAYIALALSVLFCFLVAAYLTEGSIGPTILAGICFMVLLYIFLGLCLGLKMIWEALLSRSD